MGGGAGGRCGFARWPGSCPISTGEQALQVYAMEDVSIAVNDIALAAIIVAFNFVAFLALLRLRPKSS